MNWKKAYAALLALVDELGPNVDQRELLVGLQRWLQRQLGVFSPALQQDYGLRSYAALDLAHYPIESSSLEAAERARQLRLVPPGSVDLAARQPVPASGVSAPRSGAGDCQARVPGRRAALRDAGQDTRALQPVPVARVQSR